MKKKLIAICFFFILLIVLIFRGLHGKSGYKEGTDINIITARFPDIPDISKCFYGIDIISAGGIGPTRYRITAMCLIDASAVERLEKQYNWEDAEITINDKFYNQLEVSDSIIWYHNKEFSKMIMGGRFIGEVYFSIDGKCIYLEADE